MIRGLVVCQKMMAVAALCAVTMFVTGCCRPSMQSFNVNLEVDAAVEHAFTMDLVGLRPGDDDLRNTDVNEYFRPGSALRADVRDRTWTINVPAGGMRTSQVLVDRNDPKWAHLRDAGVMELMIIVNRLNAENYMVGGTDTRQRVVSLDKCRWSKLGNQINIRAQRSRLDYSPQPEPPK